MWLWVGFWTCRNRIWVQNERVQSNAYIFFTGWEGGALNIYAKESEDNCTYNWNGQWKDSSRKGLKRSSENFFICLNFLCLFPKNFPTLETLPESVCLYINMNADVDLRSKRSENFDKSLMYKQRCIIYIGISISIWSKKILCSTKNNYTYSS